MIPRLRTPLNHVRQETFVPDPPEAVRARRAQSTLVAYDAGWLLAEFRAAGLKVAAVHAGEWEGLESLYDQESLLEEE